MALSLAQLQQLAASVGFPNAALAAAVAMAESSGVPTIVGDTNLGGSYGLWQINHPAHPQYDTQRLLSDTTYNAQAALAISKNGSDWTPWSTYTNGAYLKYYKPSPMKVVAIAVGIIGVSFSAAYVIQNGWPRLQKVRR